MMREHANLRESDGIDSRIFEYRECSLCSGSALVEKAREDRGRLRNGLEIETLRGVPDLWLIFDCDEFSILVRIA